MTDRELLEAAAKAAGIGIDWEPGVGESGQSGPWRDDKYSKQWNPLTDDGDALRLAVKLRMEIVMGKITVCTLVRGKAFSREAIGQLDPYAATRRSIVRAAAAMGEQA